MAAITFDARKLTGPLNELVKVQIPETSRLALNEALFATQKRLKDEASRVFNNPVPFTLNSFKYDKGKIEDKRVVGRAYVRDDAPGGNAPSRYLNPQIRGGPAYQTRFSRRLMHHTTVTQIDGRRTTAQQPGTMMAPALRSNSKVSRNKYGNMSQGQYTRILTSLSGGASSADLLVNGDVMASQRDQSYTYLDELALDHPYFKNRFTNYGQKPGIYKIERTANPNPKDRRRVTRFYRVMTERSIKPYKPEFRFFDISEETVTKEFVQRFQRRILR